MLWNEICAQTRAEMAEIINSRVKFEVIISPSLLLPFSLLSASPISSEIYCNKYRIFLPTFQTFIV